MQARTRYNAPLADSADVRDSICGQGAGAYLLLGDNGVDIEETVAGVVAHFTDEATRAFNCDVFHVGEPECTAEAIVNSVRAYPVLAPVRVVIVRGVEGANAAFANELALLVENLPPAVVLVLSGEKLDERTKWAAVLKKNCAVFTFAVPRNITPWIRQRAKSRGFTFDDDAAELLSDFVGTNVFRAADEIEKLTLFVQPRKTISAEDVEAVAGIARTDTVYQLNDAIDGGHSERALQIAHRLQEHSMQAATIAGLILQHWMQLRAAADVLQNPDEIPLKELVGENRDFVLKKLTDSARALGRDRIRRGVRLALAAESAMKSSWLADKSVGLDALILQLSASPRGRSLRGHSAYARGKT
ncbi:MAG TPA: DNA polymerase III subunit delta [Candidatus Latescibacteria bacterium]|nr:DNA polymerase III subunit delta [Candidatus Latescibacterota bacterium]